MQEIRLAKFINRCGICSRREAERAIACGRVKVNGVVVTELQNITIRDKVEVDGLMIGREGLLDPGIGTRVWLYNKPRGLITTHNDPGGRRTVFQAVAPFVQTYVSSVGRLDINSEGLLILTNNGFLIRKLERPDNNIKRVYMCRILGTLTWKEKELAANGLEISGVKYGKVLIQQCDTDNSDSRMQVSKANSWFKFTLFEGKNREIRKICNYFGLQVSRLVRISYGSFELGNLRSGDIRELPTKSFEKYM